eukprot:TRINITY_DN21064_c0_g1_i1.p1 TRINITY_DN21064_c0_g1~~TRINITY_DN21064_c0_g1_i1.p1  ORF type:complete len:688 (+),score=153.26 TRINITY_DN21064_c0_g1_i1:96-2159(+)
MAGVGPMPGYSTNPPGGGMLGGMPPGGMYGGMTGAMTGGFPGDGQMAGMALMGPQDSLGNLGTMMMPTKTGMEKFYSSYRGDLYGGHQWMLSPSRNPDHPPVAEVRTSRCYTVQVEFAPGEDPVGIVFDWSTAMPVISDILEDTPAMLRTTRELGKIGLMPGFVLLSVNRQKELERVQRGIAPQRVGADTRYLLTASRNEVEGLLRQRPLVLEFQAPMPQRFGDYLPQPWQQTSRQQAEFIKTLDAPKPGKFQRAPKDEDLRAPEEKLDPARHTFLEMFPERSPLTRYGDMETAPYNWPTAWYTAEEHKRKEAERQRLIAKLERKRFKAKTQRRNAALAEGTILPQIGQRTSTANASIMDISMTSLNSTSSRSSLLQDSTQLPLARSSSVPGRFGEPRGSIRGGRPWSNASNVSRTSKASMQSSKSSFYSPGVGSWYTAQEEEPRPPDQCYSKLILALEHDETEKLWYGPGLAKRWSMDHQEDYDCVASDMILVLKVSEAYEVSYRGWKKEKPTAIEIANYLNPPVRHTKVSTVDEAAISCDMCGTDICLDFNSPPFPFFYCRKCKRNGHRHELCLPCFAVEILQGQGKHMDRGPHPHYLNCTHHSLVEMPDLRMAYPSCLTVRRIHCDHCGKLMNFKSKECNFYLCPQCPEVHGLRFELCETCALDMRDRGHSMRRLLHAVGMPHR